MGSEDAYAIGLYYRLICYYGVGPSELRYLVVVIITGNVELDLD